MNHDGRQAISRPATVVGTAALFLLLTLAYTYPVWTAPDTLLNELADVRLNAWIMAWDAHALASSPGSLFDANAFFPYRNSLAFSENLLGAAIWVAPVNWAGHPILAYNIVLLGSFFLAGVGVAAWVRRLSGSVAAGVLAGVMWAFAPARTDHLPHIQILATPWIPFAMLALTRYVELGRRRDMVVAAAMLAMQYASGLNMALIALPFAVLYVSLLLLSGPALPGSLTGRRLVADVGLAAVVLGAVALPLSLPYLRARSVYGFERTLEEAVGYSAQFKSYLSPGWAVTAPHMRSLFETFRLPEGNYFPGTLGAALGLGVLAFVLPAAVRGRWPGGEAGNGAPVAPGIVRSVHRVALALAAGAASLHAAGVAVAFWWSRPPWAEAVLSLNQVARPTIWLALAATLALATWRPATWDLRPRALVVLAYLAMLAYLLSLGPLVRSWGAELGDGPYRLVYELLPPYRSIRAVGRFGVQWVLVWAALSGLGLSAGLEAIRRRGHAGLRATIGVLLITGIAWECRTWPIPAEDARAQDAEVYDYLATLPAGTRVLHVPVIPRLEPWRATEYMLGSTRHWLPMVNGYSGFLPDDLVRLADLDPFSQEFVDRVRDDYPVDVVVYHGGKLGGTYFDENVAPLLIEQQPDLRLLARLESPRGYGDGLVFALRRDRDRRTVIRRRYDWKEFDAAVGLEMEVRVGGRGRPEQTLEVIWDEDEVATFAVDDKWEALVADKPAGATAGPDGSTWLELRTSRREPLAGTELMLSRELMLDVQEGRAALARDDVWLFETETPGVLFDIRNEGRTVRKPVGFEVEEAAGAIRDFVADLPVGHIVAVGINPPRPLEVSEDLAQALRSLGSSIAPGATIRRFALIGAVGAAAGSVAEDGNVEWAAVRVGPLASELPEIAIRGLRLVPRR